MRPRCEVLGTPAFGGMDWDEIVPAGAGMNSGGCAPGGMLSLDVFAVMGANKQVGDQKKLKPKTA